MRPDIAEPLSRDAAAVNEINPRTSTNTATLRIESSSEDSCVFHGTNCVEITPPDRAPTIPERPKIVYNLPSTTMAHHLR